MDDDFRRKWLLKYFHPHGLQCLHGEASVKRAREFRQTAQSHLTVYRCRKCQGTYTLYSQTVLAATQLRPVQVVLLLRAVCKGESSATLARELKLSRMTVHGLCQARQAHAQREQPQTPLKDRHTETDELFQNARKGGPVGNSW